MATKDQNEDFDSVLQEDEETLYHLFYSAMKLKAREEAYESYQNFIKLVKNLKHSRRTERRKEKAKSAMNEMDKLYHLAQGQSADLGEFEEGSPSDLDILSYYSRLTKSNGEKLGPEEYFEIREDIIQEIEEEFEMPY